MCFKMTIYELILENVSIFGHEAKSSKFIHDPALYKKKNQDNP